MNAHPNPETDILPIIMVPAINTAMSPSDIETGNKIATIKRIKVKKTRNELTISFVNSFLLGRNS